MESLEQGHEPRHPAGLLLALVGALVAGLAVSALAWVADARWRANATADLVLAFDETLSAVEIAERRVQSVAEYTRPARDRADMDPSERESLDELVRDAASESAADIAAQRSRVDAVRLLPWHADLRIARDQAGAWLDLRATGIVSLATTGRTEYAPREQLDSARTALRDAWEAIRSQE
jgi:hypothetical protein